MIKGLTCSEAGKIGSEKSKMTWEKKKQENIKRYNLNSNEKS